MQAILDKIAEKAGSDLVTLLAETLTGSELNSLLLEVFDRKTASMRPADLLRQYAINRFVQPSDTDVIQLRTKELAVLQLLQALNFTPLELSPVSLLGTSSVLGSVDQKKIISATRGTEVLSDATNAMAIHIASQQQLHSQAFSSFCTTHRHIRTPPVKVKGHSAHFTIACCVSAGTDTGNYNFETTAITTHFTAIQRILKEIFDIDVQYFKLQPRAGYKNSEQLLETITRHLKDSHPIQVDTTVSPNAYYQGIQYKAVITHQGNDIEIADGGFVNWTQKLLQNKKARFFISGLGIEYLSRIL
ncbi:hypothetical protein [Chitinophaga rhizophila]|uniref:Uncharacterized protein n=1 Tax=Chitinophaga rhizophila TaxID=2866212 RepID=A0ABS7GN46_9BACT|nr:hypothetical protein [Chitinophaga rhizophila]MBW8688213.1 hypothetical protein [Chitinophaga rhizophila]